MLSHYVVASQTIFEADKKKRNRHVEATKHSHIYTHMHRHNFKQTRNLG